MNARSKLATVATAALLSGVAACTPTPTVDPVPATYPRCTGQPTCKVGIGRAVFTTAVSDDGDVVSSRRKFPSGAPEYDVLALVGVDDHWYREISRGTFYGDGSTTPHAERSLVLSRGDLAGLPDPDGAAGSDEDVYTYDRSTETWTRPAQPDGHILGVSSISADGRWAVVERGFPTQDILLFDLDADTWQVIGTGYDPSISADGSVVVWADRSISSSEVPGSISRYDRVAGTTSDLGVVGRAPSVSGDGSRVIYRSSTGDRGLGNDDQLWMLDDGGSPVLVDDELFVTLRSWLSADGRYLTAYVETGGPGPVVRQYDLSDGSHRDVTSASLLSELLTVSPDGGQVVYRAGDDEYRWSR